MGCSDLGLGMKPCSHGTHGSCQMLTNALSPTKKQAPLMIISLAFSIALQIGEAFLGGSCRASYVEPCISISEFPYINYHAW